MRRDPVPTPGDDDFYVAPPGLGDLAPGTVLRSRRVPLAFFGRLRHGSAVQLMYRSTDAHGVPEAAVTPAASACCGHSSSCEGSTKTTSCPSIVSERVTTCHHA